MAQDWERWVDRHAMDPREASRRSSDQHAPATGRAALLDRLDAMPAWSKRLAVALLLLAVIWFMWPPRARSRPAGVLIRNPPAQVGVSGLPVVEIKNYQITKRAEFHLNGRVLSRTRYRFDSGSEISPIDLAMGWGPMSDSAVLDRLSISQQSRWYRYSWYGQAPIQEAMIAKHSANMHMIPADSEVLRKLLGVRVGDCLELRGFLVDVDHPSGWHWRTSMRRDDTGGHSCELIYVTEIVRIW